MVDNFEHTPTIIGNLVVWNLCAIIDSQNYPFF